ncbi:MAG: hypothetical protein LAP13_07790 [Acidobacteriia bacterium]|nr:hypothetical protein [Terriglobia bacterium]
MKLIRTLAFLMAIQLLFVGLTFGQGFKVESTGALTASDVPKATQDLLPTQGMKVVSEQGSTLLEVWLPKTVPASASPTSSSDILYGALSEGVFLGVVHYPAQNADFRGHPIKPGYYTLRYALIPQDGNHMGVFATRDVVHLCPAASDTNLEKPLSSADMTKMGSAVSGTPHPAFLVMAPVSGSSFPAVVTDDQGYVDLVMKLHEQSGELPVALTIVGKWSG